MRPDEVGPNLLGFGPQGRANQAVIDHRNMVSHPQTRAPQTRVTQTRVTQTRLTRTRARQTKETQTADDYSPLGEPTISPKAQLSKRISIEMFETLFGTLTATGTRPLPQQLPGNLASATTLPVALSVTTIKGDLPTGFQSRYSSLVAP